MHAIIIQKSVQLAAHAPDVWAYLSEAEAMGKWLNARVAIQPRAGGTYEELGQHNDNAYVLRGRVLKAVAPAEMLLAYRVDTDAQRRWPVFTAVTFSLTPRPTGTTITVSHSGFENLPERYRDFTRADFDFGWGAALERLQAMLANT